jgi:hypothetical protein
MLTRVIVRTLQRVLSSGVVMRVIVSTASWMARRGEGPFQSGDPAFQKAVAPKRGRVTMHACIHRRASQRKPVRKRENDLRALGKSEFTRGFARHSQEESPGQHRSASHLYRKDESAAQNGTATYATVH